MIYLNTPEEFLAWKPDKKAKMFQLSYYYSGLSEFGQKCVLIGDKKRVTSFLAKMAVPERYAKMELYYSDPESRVAIIEYDKDGDPI